MTEHRSRPQCRHQYLVARHLDGEKTIAESIDNIRLNGSL